MRGSGERIGAMETDRITGRMALITKEDGKITKEMVQGFIMDLTKPTIKESGKREDSTERAFINCPMEYLWKAYGKTAFL